MTAAAAVEVAVVVLVTAVVIAALSVLWVAVTERRIERGAGDEG